LAAIEGSGADTDFLFYSIDYYRRELSRLAQGTTFEAIGSRELFELELPLPPLPTQRRIAAVLRTVDEVIEATEARIAKQQSIKQGLLHDLFTRGVTPDGQLRPPPSERPDLYRESELGLIPREWEVCGLSELCSQIVDGVHHTPSYVESGVPFVTVRNLTSGFGINFSDTNKITARDHQIFSRRVLPKVGDVLVSKDGTLGVSRIVPEGHPEFSIFVSVAVLRPVEAIVRPEIVHSFFDRGAFETQLGGLSAGTGLKHIHLEHFRKFELAVPPMSEQLRILELSSSVTKDLVISNSRLTKLQHLKLALMQDLLTGRVSADSIDLDVLPA